MSPPVLVQFGPWLITPAQHFWIVVAFWVYVVIGLIVWFAYARTKLAEEDGGRGLDHILIGLLHGVLWPVYVALAIFVAWAS